ncbi:MAG: sigma-54-dependent Fis family transcriptional regulator [Bdellovibrionales bacterium]|nr:sigma-54-dependent Fis family transcriptional regulator [Bdellovibrionales bacterium]
MSLRILIADDEAELRLGIRGQIQSRGFVIDEASDGQRAWDMIQKNPYDLVLLDVRMPVLDGIEVLSRLKESHPSTTVAVITAHANVQDAVKAIHLGAFDYIEKPVRPERLDELVDKALAARSLVEQIAFSSPRETDAPGEANSRPDFIGHSEPMRRIFKLIDRLAKVSTSVLIRGENGTGKELVAKAIHFNSPRKHRPFTAVNCGAIPEALIESELFGHEKGAFTGAAARKIGMFQHASGGTLFLDEIGDLPLQMQVKLLRALQEQKITPVGSTREMNVDVRIIAATNRDLETMMTRGDFRQDLFYRLNVMPVFLPPLRERAQDIPHLVQHFIAKFNQKHGRQVSGVEADALSKLQRYSWPGNIRELENAVEHAFVVDTGEVLAFASFPDHIQESILDQEEGWHLPSTNENSAPVEARAEMTFSLDYHKDKERFEREFIIQALKRNGGRINQTCENTNIPKNTLLRKIKKYGITAKDYE